MSNDVFIVGGTVITGDGATMLPNATVHVRDGLIADIDSAGNRPSADHLANGATVVDAERGFVIPGVVNGHVHGCSTGPLFSSAAQPLDRSHAWRNAERHLSAGVTTLVNVCGFGLPSDLEALADHPIRTFVSTTHFPEAVAAARIVDGAGFDPAHEQITAEAMIEAGAAAIGEVGSGATLGGGVAAYRYVPQAVREICGDHCKCGPAVATAMIDALLGPSRGAPAEDPSSFIDILDRHSFLDRVEDRPTAIDAMRNAVVKYAHNPVRHSLATFESAAALSARTGMPAVFHVAEPSVAKLLEVAAAPANRDAVLVAGHLNHPSIATEEVVAWAHRLRERGVVIDVSVLDGVSTLHLTGPENQDALISSGLVDTLSTDYAGGHWDSMLEAVQRWWRRGLLTLPQGVALATARPAAVFRHAAGNRGLLARGYAADILVCDEVNIGRVRTVLIDGRVVRDLGGSPPHAEDC